MPRIDYVDPETAPEAERLAVAFGRQAAVDLYRLTEADFDRLCEAGYADAEPMELPGVVGLFEFVNTVDMAVDIRPADRDGRLPPY